MIFDLSAKAIFAYIVQSDAVRLRVEYETVACCLKLQDFSVNTASIFCTTKRISDQFNQDQISVAACNLIWLL